MTRQINRKVTLPARPEGLPEARHFQIVEEAVAEPAAGQVLVRVHYLSADPAMRGWVQATANYAEPVALGAVMKSFAVGTVVQSRHSAYTEGDLVTGLFGWQEWALIDASTIDRTLDPSSFGDVPMSAALGVLGLTGVTAYFGLFDVGRPVAGETVVVSAGAGSVGSCVGQLTKIAGCRAVAIVGSAQKAQIATDAFGYDAAVTYRSPAFRAELAAACPNGIDVYFDNTAGISSDVALEQINTRARIVICGTIAHADWSPHPQGPVVNRHLLVKRARMQGFIAPDYQHRWGEALTRLAMWIRSGELTFREEVLEGIESAPASIVGLYTGENLGKRVIRLFPGA
jgi:NADPH-dependent curcumin reductase CurA